MTRPCASTNWYDPGASGMLPDSGRFAATAHCRGWRRPSHGTTRWEVDGKPGGSPGVMLRRRRARFPGERSPLRGRQPRGVATGLSPAGHESQPHKAVAKGPNMLRLQVPLPDRYTRLSALELEASIRDAKDALGARLLILGHH